MKKPVLDIHTHTIVSGHAYGTIREMAQAASEKGLSGLGLSEHAPGITGTTDPIYFMNLSAVPRNLYGVDIFHGSEINVLNDGTLSLGEKYINKLDYGIVGIHDLCYTDAGIEKNTDNLISCMKHEKVFFVSHPDDNHTPLDYERLVKAAKEYHVALEVNNSSFRKPERRLNCVENYKTMLKLCMKYRTNIVVNSDSHDPSQVGSFDSAMELIESVGFDEELIVNLDMDRFKNFISFNK